MAPILAFYGSPRRHGNSAALLDQAVLGAREAGAAVEEIVLRDLAISPCLEIYGCREKGRCVIDDDFQVLFDKIENCGGIMVASPVFFYAVSSHLKILMDRCQSFWVRRNWYKGEISARGAPRPGLLLAVGATRGKKLFDGVVLSVRYFFEAIDVELHRSLLYRGIDHRGEIDGFPDYLAEARAAGRELAGRVLLQQNGPKRKGDC